MPPAHSPTVAVVGGGAAGFFAAIACAEANPRVRVDVFEQSAQFLTKVLHSGGGRCNVTHACFEPRLLATRFPRGERPLISPFHQFHTEHAVAWFEDRGVPLKTEPDGRIFPRSDRSTSIIDCLLDAAKAAGVGLHTQTPVTAASFADGRFELTTNKGPITADRVLLATGGSRVPAGARIAESFGHHPIQPVPSLFTFNADVAWVRALAGVACEAEAAIETIPLRQTGPVLFTHRGLSGPAILRLSAWGARELEAHDYHFDLRLNFLPGKTQPLADALLQSQRDIQPGKKVTNSPLAGLPARLWEQLCKNANVPPDTRWTTLPRPAREALAAALVRTVLPVTGKSLNKDEFVTCGGIPCTEVDFKTMQSRLQPGLHFAGELLDIDGITGGFNFQAAWTTGWLAGHAMAG